MELHSSTVQRNLDAKFKIMGLEAPDLLSVLIFAAVMNLFFGNSNFAVVLVVVIPALLLAALYIGKKGRPEMFMIHLLRFYLTPGFYSAGEESGSEQKRRTKIYE